VSQRASVRRTDVRLRAAYPHIITEIYEVGPYNHVIVVPREQLEAAAFAKEFSDNFRALTNRVELSNQPPPNGTLLSPIADGELAKGLEGLHLTRSDLVTCLLGMFPGSPDIMGFADRPGGILEIRFAEALPALLDGPIRNFISAHLHGRPFEITASTEPEKESKSVDNPLLHSIEALKFKPIRHRPEVPRFVEDDEAWWFKNLEALFEGRISPQSFEIARAAGSACFIGGGAFPSIDLRQAILAYDTVYLQPPFAGPESAFWKSQAIDRDDLLRLVQADRVRLIHAQPEERSDLGFLREAHTANPKGVLGRRMTAAMMIADIVETADEYTLGQTHLTNEVREVITRLAEHLTAPVDEVAKSLLYPSHVRRACLEPLLERGLMGVATFGQGELFAQAYKRVRGQDILLEASTFGQAIHTAHMLNATFIPPPPLESYVGSWLTPMQLMGDRLNFYRSFNTRIAAVWASNERRKEKREIVLPPVPIIDFSRHASIEDIIIYTSQGSVQRKGRALITRLANLPEEERAAEIDRLQTELYQLELKRDRRQATLRWLDTTSSLVTFAMDISLFPFTAGWTLIKLVLDRARKAPALDRVIDALEQQLTEVVQINQDLDFLSKISRVAALRETPKAK